ncbi:MAG: tetratricopeptide repeat protein [Bacteroidetes bacterium]|nr:tetratricopeptide repeat protein [Bacteroidota bacterium]
MLSHAASSDSLLQLLPGTSGRERVELLNLIAQEIAEDNPSEALQYAGEALALSQKAGYRKQEALALKILADATYYLENFTGAIDYYAASAEVVLDMNGEEDPDYIRRIGDIGYCYNIMDQSGKAYYYFMKELDLAIKINFQDEIATAHNNLGYIYTEWGDYGEAADHFKSALEIDRAAGVTTYLSTAYNNLGKVYELWGKYDEAISWYTEALRIDETRGNKAGIAVRMSNIGTTYLTWKKYHEALDYFEKALELERQVGDGAKIGRRLAYIGETWLALDNHNLALSYFKQALPFFQARALDHDLARLYRSMGKYYLSIGNYREALNYFETSQELAKSGKLKPLLMSNLRDLSEVYEKTGQATQALSAYKSFSEMKDSVFTTESSKKLAEYRARYENEQIQHENDILKKDADLRRKNHAFLWVLFSLVATALASTLIIFRFRAANLRQQKVIAEQHAENLHKDLELKNNELAYHAMCIVQNNETVSRMTESVKEMLQADQPPEKLGDILDHLKTMKNDKAWKEFEIRFTQVHSEFYDRLQATFPDLTPNEKKLCAFLRLNMTTKDIAAITHQTPHSINVARTRLRKKLNLSNNEENLINFLMNF